MDKLGHSEPDKSASSMACAAMLLARKVFGALADRSVLLVGSGEIAELAVKHLQAACAAPMRVADRSLGRAQEVAARLGVQVADFDALHASLGSADVVICGSTSSNYIFTKENVFPALRQRRFRSLLMVDFGVPGGVAPDLGELESVFAYNLHDIERIVGFNPAACSRAA